MNTFGETNTRALQKAETRARVLSAARRHFAEHGFDAANVRDIAKEAGVAAGTVLLHFADKRDLLHAALFDDLAAVIDEALAAPPRPRASLHEQLLAMGRAFFGYYAASPALSRTLLKESLLAEPPWRERYTAQVARVHVHVAGLARRAKDAGVLAPEANEAVLAASFLSFYYFALIGWMQGGTADPIPLFAAMLAQHLEPLVSAKPKRAVTKVQPRRTKR